VTRIKNVNNVFLHLWFQANLTVTQTDITTFITISHTKFSIQIHTLYMQQFNSGSLSC